LCVWSYIIACVEIPDSSFTKMVRHDLSQVIVNYRDVEITARYLGMESSLVEV